MDHFSAEEWVEFSRRVLPSAEMDLIQVHLDDRCNECLKSSETWQVIMELLSQEARYQPPESAVTEVKAAYIPEKPWRWLIQVARSTQLVFDSFRQAMPAAVRACMPSSRQLVYEAEPYVIDLRLEPAPARKRVMLIGQILNSKNPDQAVNRADVVLLSGEDIVVSTSANASGEFDLEFGRTEDLRLFINIRGQRAIGIALTELVS